MKRNVIIALCAAALALTAVFGIVKLTTNDNEDKSSSNSEIQSNSNFELNKYEDYKLNFEGIYTSNMTVGSGVNYYVSIDGNDSSDGTSEENSLKTISKALAKASAGDTIIIRKGVYSEAINISKSGTKNNPITIKAYEGEEVVLDYKNTKVTEGITIDSESFINIEGLKICNITESSSSAAIGIYIAGESSNITIKNCEIYNMKAVGDKGNAHAILVSGNSSKKSTSYIRLENNYVHDNLCGWSEAIAVNGNVEFCDVINNKVNNISNIGIDIIGGEGTCEDPSLDVARKVYIAGNIVTNCKSTYARCAGIYADGSKDVWINGNIVTNCESGIEVGAECTGASSENITVTNNLLSNNSQVSIIVGSYEKNTGNVKNVNIANNTIYHTGTDHIIEMSTSENINYKNNILYSTSDVNILETGTYTKSDIKNVTFESNVVYSSSDANFNYLKKEYDLDGFSKAVGGSNNTYIDPLFVEIGKDFSLKANSPCINKGSSSVSNIIGDIDLSSKNRKNNAVDIGAYEYNK